MNNLLICIILLINNLQVEYLNNNIFRFSFIAGNNIITRAIFMKI